MVCGGGLSELGHETIGGNEEASVLCACEEVAVCIRYFDSEIVLATFVLDEFGSAVHLSTRFASSHMVHSDARTNGGVAFVEGTLGIGRESGNKAAGRVLHQGHHSGSGIHGKQTAPHLRGRFLFAYDMRIYMFHTSDN